MGGSWREAAHWRKGLMKTKTHTQLISVLFQITLEKSLGDPYEPPSSDLGGLGDNAEPVTTKPE